MSAPRLAVIAVLALAAGCAAPAPALTTWIPDNAAGAPLVIDDFEDGNTRSAIGSPWGAYSDRVLGGTSAASIAIIDGGGANGSAKALRLSGDVGGSGMVVFAGMGVALKRGAHFMDVTKFQGLRLSARTETAPVFVQMVIAAVGDYNQYSYELPVSKDWVHLRIPFGDFRQASFFGRRVGWTGRDIRAIHIHTAARGPVTVDLDDVALY